MKAIGFKEQTIVIAKDQPEYLPLPAHVFPQDPSGRMAFCWQLSWWERLKLLLTGRIWQQVLTFNNHLQPQLLSVEKPEMLPWKQQPAHMPKAATMTACLLLLVFFCGCSYTREIGSIGKRKVHVIQKTSFLGPSICVIAIEDGDDLHLTQSFGGNGILPGVTGGGALVGASAVFGGAIRPSTSTTHVNQGQNQSAEGGGGGNGGSAVIDSHNTTHNNTTLPHPMPPSHKPMKHGGD